MLTYTPAELQQAAIIRDRIASATRRITCENPVPTSFALKLDCYFIQEALSRMSTVSEGCVFYRGGCMSSGSLKQAVDRTIELLGADIAIDQAVDQACRELGGGFAPEHVKRVAQDEWSDAARKAAAEARRSNSGGSQESSHSESHKKHKEAAEHHSSEAAKHPKGSNEHTLHFNAALHHKNAAKSFKDAETSRKNAKTYGPGHSIAEKMEAERGHKHAASAEEASKKANASS